ncbi:MAG: FecR family protein [Cyanobacteria bacterium]|nr:FecR family protein [Cyanobacteriota bacterium]
MPPAHHCFAAGASLGLAIALLLGASAAVSATPAVPRVVEVPSRPAFTKPPGGSEDLARPGQVLATRSLLRTQKPGRMQVQLANGRSFRLGGNAVARLGADGLDLESGQIIAWVNPGSKGGGSPLKIRTRVGTASIMGTTVFIDSTPEAVKVFSWEGHVTVMADAGQRFELHSGEQVVFEQGAWLPPRRLSLQEAAERRTKSILLNGFDTPMETLPVIERELGLRPLPANAASPSPR